MASSLTARREYLGSPIFSEQNSGSLAANAVTVFDFSSNASQAQKYAPFNFITVTNNSSSAIKLYINQDDNRAILVPASTIRELDKKSVPGIRSVRIENVGSATINASEITVEVQRETVDGETVLQKAANRLFGGRGI